MIQPTRRALTLTAAGLPLAALAVLVSPQLWLFWLAFVVAWTLALGVDALWAPRPRDVLAAASIPALIEVGRAVEGRLKLQVNAVTAVPLRVAIDVAAPLVPPPQTTARVSRAGVELPFPLLPQRRGRVRVERAWVRAQGPLGLMTRQVILPLDREALAVPDLRPVHSQAVQWAAGASARAGLRIERARGDGSELDSLREHALGDDLRALDWRVSARHRRLITRQFRAERNQQVVLAIDTGRLMTEPLAGVPKVDQAAAAALLLGYVALRAGDRVGWFSFDAREGAFAAPRSGARVFPELRRLAGELDYSDLETNYTLGLTHLAERLHRRSLVVVLTDFVDTVTAELLVDNLRRLSRHHLVVFVALRDPTLEAVAAAPPLDAPALHRALVAGALIRERQAVLTRLRGHGITPLDATPSELHPRLLRTYLEIKRRERI